MDSVGKTLKQHYEKTFQQFGATSMGVDWGDDPARQYLRYDKMLAVIRQDQQHVPTILDVGCGYGGLMEYAGSKEAGLLYTGIDVAENMISWASDAFPESQFIVGDIFETDLRREYDYVICNGILTQKLDIPGSVMDDFAGRLIRRLFELCRIGIAFNIMTTKVNFFSNNLYYRNPSEMLSWCMSEVTPHVMIDHAYPLYEYTIYLYREP